MQSVEEIKSYPESYADGAMVSNTSAAGLECAEGGC
jgi:hypothetical protein